MRISLAVMVTGVALGLLMRPVDLSAGGALITVVVFISAGLLGYGVRERRERFETDVVAARERAALSASQERLRITRELHDIIGHAMSVMVVQAGVAEQLLDTDPERARAAVAQIGSTGRTSLSEMRQVLAALRDGDPDPAAALPRDPAPGLAQVPTLAARVEAAGLPVTLTVQGDVRPLPPALELAAYRVVQEALTNCLKHAGATRARVLVSHSPDDVRVVVDDDGRSSAAGPGSQGGHGIAGMRERVTVYGGELSAGPRPDGGFRVDALFPVRPASHPVVTPS
jgi:signal transduction histidine kinase